ncbi:MAG: hypothetical protein ACHRHE_15790, partial [Tepidisphaerales bacterium]
MTDAPDNLTSPLVTPERPWPGLAAFDESSTGYFFGRDADGDNLRRLVKRETLSVLFGQSGLGKTSLLQAWLFPHLRREDCMPVLVRLVHAEDAPPLAGQFMSAVAAEIASGHIDAPMPRSGQTLWEYFHDKRADFWSSRQRLLTPVIVLDQFEELFTLGRASDTARQRGQAFVTELADLIENRPPESLKARLESGEAQAADYNFDPAAFRIVITLRADFLSELETLSGVIPSLQHNRMLLSPLNGMQACEAVTRPGAALIDADVALRIVQFVAGSAAQTLTEEQLAAMRVEPALLSIICRELNERRLARDLPKITADLVAGDRAEILSDFYERSLAGTSPEVRLWVENQLLTVSGYRNSQDIDDALVKVGRASLDALVARRLLRIDDRFGTQRVELTHDVLAAPVRASRDERQQREELARAAERERATRLELRIARRRMSLVMVLVLFLLGFGLFSHRQWRKATAAEVKADQATERAQSSLRTAQDRLVTSLSYEGSYLVLTHRTTEARQVLHQGMKLLPDTSVSPLWITAPLLDSDARFGSPVSDASAFSGHANRVTSVAVSPDGSRILSGSSDALLKLWDVATGREIRTFKGHTGSVLSVAFSPDGRTALSGSADKTLILWDVETANQVRPFVGHRDRARAVISPDGRLALSGSDDRTLKLWDIGSGKEVLTFKGPGHAGKVECVVISPDGRTALSGSDDKTIKLWDMATGTEMRTFAGHTAVIRSVAFAPDGRTFLSGGDDCTIRLWDVAAAKPSLRFQGDSLQVSGQTDLILAHSEPVWGVAFAPDGRTALSGGDDKTLKLWNIATGKQIRTFAGHTDWVTRVAFSPDGRTAFSASVDKTLKQWDVATDTEIPTFTGHGDEVRRVAISPDGRTALATGNDKTLRLMDMATMKEIRCFTGHEKPLIGVSFAPDGRTAISSSEDGTLRLWDLAAGKEIQPPFRGHVGTVWSVAFLPDGRSVLSGGTDKTMKQWDVATHKEIRTFSPAHAGHIYCIAVSPDGRSALSASQDNTVRLWNLETGQVIRELAGHTYWVIGVAFSPDGSLALSGSADKTMKLWDLASGKEIRDFAGHTESVLGVVFSPDGRTALSASYDKTLKLWDLGSGKEIQTFTGHTDWVRNVAFTPDGSAAISASNDKTVKLWDFSRPARHIEFEAKLPAARAALVKNAEDPAALGIVGRWYAFRGDDELAIQYLERARKAGGRISPLMLGQCYWNLSRYPEALAQYEEALARKEAPESYLSLC